MHIIKYIIFVCETHTDLLTYVLYREEEDSEVVYNMDLPPALLVHQKASAMSLFSPSGGDFDLPPTQPPMQGMFGGSAVAAQASAMSLFSPSGGDFGLPPALPPVQGMFDPSAVAAQASAMSSPSGGDDPELSSLQGKEDWKMFSKM